MDLDQIRNLNPPEKLTNDYDNIRGSVSFPRDHQDQDDINKVKYTANIG